MYWSWNLYIIDKLFWGQAVPLSNLGPTLLALEPLDNNFAELLLLLVFEPIEFSLAALRAGTI